MITPEQLEKRKNHIGGSDISAILGLNPFSSGYDVWCDKVYENNPIINSDAIDTGNALESAIVEWAAKRYGLEYDDTPEKLQFVCKEHPIFMAHIDALALNYPTAIEGKYTSLSDEWGDSGTDHIPQRVYNQCQVQILCGGWDYIIVSVWISEFGMDKRHFVVQRNPKRIEQIIKFGELWWKKYVLTKTPPLIDAPPNTETFDRIVRVEGEIVNIPRKMWSDYKILKLKTKQAKTEEDKALAEIKAHMGNAEAGRIPDTGKLYYQRKTKVSAKLSNPTQLKLKYPDAYAECINEEQGMRWGEYKEGV